MSSVLKPVGWFTVVIAGVALSAGYLVGCKKGTDSVPGTVTDQVSAPSAANALNVLLITLDTTRADRLGCYGYEAARTPTLDGLAARGVRFAHAFTHVPLTLPAHSTLLSGLYPPTTGVRINGTHRVSDQVRLLSEAFKDQGYRTGAFVAAWVLNSAFGLSQGFDRYDDEVGGGQATWGHDAERPADEVSTAALKWLEQDRTQPFFAWVHFFDPHHPYEPPKPFAATGLPYDGEIAFMDSQIKRILDWIEGAGLTQRTVVVVAGDHGESMGEHDEPEHGLLIYDTTMHVPLIVAAPGHFPAGTVHEPTVRLVDVVPTVLDVMGWDDWAGLAGKSLLPVISAQSATGLPVYTETLYPRMSFGWAGLRALYSDRWKYIDGPVPELYDRLADPNESTNVYAAHRDVAIRMKAELASAVGHMAHGAVEQVSLDSAAMQKLSALGYVNASRGTVDDGLAKNPIDMLHVFRGLMRARSLNQAGQYEETVAVVEPLLQESPESDMLWAVVGEAYLETGRIVEAQQAFETSLRSQPNDPVSLCGLGDALAAQGKHQDAVLCYQGALAEAPQYGQAHSRLGLLYARQQDWPSAERHYRQDVALRPRSPNALSNLANVLLASGQAEEAARTLARALSIDPQYGPAHENYWRALLWSGQGAAAVAALAGARPVSQRPDDLDREMAWILATTSDPELRDGTRAVQLAEACCSSVDSAIALDVRAAAYAAAGNYNKARELARRARALAGTPTLKSRIAERLALYEAGQGVFMGY